MDLHLRSRGQQIQPAPFIRFKRGFRQKKEGLRWTFRIMFNVWYNISAYSQYTYKYTNLPPNCSNRAFSIRLLPSLIPSVRRKKGEVIRMGMRFYYMYYQKLERFDWIKKPLNIWSLIIRNLDFYFYRLFLVIFISSGDFLLNMHDHSQKINVLTDIFGSVSGHSGLPAPAWPSTLPDGCRLTDDIFSTI